MDPRSGAIVLALVAAATLALAAESDYRATIEKWRQDREAGLKADDGWLTVSGLFWLKEGENRFGSGTLNDFVLPTSAPEEVGVFELRDGKVTVRILPEVNVSMNGKPVQTAELKPAGPGPADTLVVGPLTLFVHTSGDRLAIRMRDKNSKIRRDFTGLKWFPIDESYRVTAQLVPYAEPKKVQVPNILGDLESYIAPGYLTFTLGGQELKLEAFMTGPEAKSYFIIFRDLTSGKETYPAARFLYADLAKEGQTVLDFNKAYNPPCAFSPFTTCPLPPEMNRLRYRVLAGEMNYGHGGPTD